MRRTETVYVPGATEKRYCPSSLVIVPPADDPVACRACTVAPTTARPPSASVTRPLIVPFCAAALATTKVRPAKANASVLRIDTTITHLGIGDETDWAPVCWMRGRSSLGSKYACSGSGREPGVGVARDARVDG